MHGEISVHKHVCVRTCMQTYVRALCICCIGGDAALCLPHWSIWKVVREMNDCRYIDYCSLPLCCLLPLSFLSAPCSISPFSRPSTSPPLPFFSSLPSHPFPALPLPLSSSIFFSSISPFVLFSLHFTEAQSMSPCNVVEWPLESRPNPVLKDSLPSGT